MLRWNYKSIKAKLLLRKTSQWWQKVNISVGFELQTSMNVIINSKINSVWGLLTNTETAVRHGRSFLLLCSGFEQTFWALEPLKGLSTHRSVLLHTFLESAWNPQEAFSHPLQWFLIHKSPNTTLRFRCLSSHLSFNAVISTTMTGHRQNIRPFKVRTVWFDLLWITVALREQSFSQHEH